MISIINRFEDISDNKLSLYKTVVNKHWYRIKDIETSIVNYFKKNNFKTLLEIGADHYSFPIATAQINCKPCDKPIETIIMDIDKDIIPKSDNSFDFGYSRHTFEDIQNPDFAFKEFIRTCRNGYIETPSPLIECLQNVDASSLSKNYKGYIHHRYIIWTDITDNSIHFLPKFPLIEYINFPTYLHNIMLVLANEYPIYWNNYYMWNKDNAIQAPKFVIYKQGMNFNIFEYEKVLVNAILKSIEATNHYVKTFLEVN